MWYSVRNAAVVRTLCPAVQERCELLLQRLADNKIDVLLTSGKRSKAEQDALYAQGRTKPGRIVTYVSGEDSEHVYGVAVDIVGIDEDGIEQYNNVNLYKRIDDIAGQLGFQWGFRRWGFDMPHFSYLGGLTLEDLKKGKLPVPIPKPPTLNQIEREIAHLQKILQKQPTERRKAILVKLGALRKALLRLG